MNEMVQDIGRRMPSADWVAFGVAVTCSALGMVVHQLNLVVPVAVFLPSILRELGLLKDGDEYTRRIMHRAGFHALLVAALLVFVTWGAASPGRAPLSLDLLTGETLRKVIMYTFVVSYLLQYWGGRDGSFRILLGMALWVMMPLVAMVARPDRYPAGVTGALVGMAAVMVGLAFMARRWPRVGGVSLLALFMFLVIGSLDLLGKPFAGVAIPSMMLQAFILPGAMGVALLMASRTHREEP